MPIVCWLVTKQDLQESLTTYHKIALHQYYCILRNKVAVKSLKTGIFEVTLSTSGDEPPLLKPTAT